MNTEHLMKQFRLTAFAVVSALLLFGCGSDDSPNNTSDDSSYTQSSRDITVVNGYIIDGNVTDSNGQQASEDADVPGLYHFADDPVYPIRFTVGTGRIADTNMTMDINMSAVAGSVISPVTTLVEGDSIILLNLATVLNYSDPTKLFSDYIQTDDTDLAKLAQLCYAMIRDTNATQSFLNGITTGFDDTVDTDVSALITNTLRRDAHRVGSRLFLIKLRGYDDTPADMETSLAAYKADIDYSYDVNNTSLRTLVSAFLADDTNTTLAKRIIYADTSAVTDMSMLFYPSSGNFTFNLDISGWDTSKVTDMNNMFSLAYYFNQPIGDWDTAQVTDMNNMFSNTYYFDQPIGRWDTSNVTDMSTMFFGAYPFNQPIGDWNTSNVTDMHGMFQNANSFNQPLGRWDTSKVTSMVGMLFEAFTFYQDVSDWNVSNVTKYDVFDDLCPIQGTNLIPQAWWGTPGL